MIFKLIFHINERVTILLGEKKIKDMYKTGALFLAFTGKHTQRQRHSKVCFTEAELLTAQVSVCSHYLYNTPLPSPFSNKLSAYH